MLAAVVERPVKAVSRGLAVALLASGLVAGLVITNPGPAAFADYGGGRLTSLLVKELCGQDGLTGMLRLLIRHCPALILSQRQVLGTLVETHSRRRNYGLFSVYHTELDLAALLPGLRQIPDLRLPRYEATTLAGAGQFLLIETREPR
ncbi:MAG: DUF4359 domain-containing protein [Cyanobacteriota bacterium]|jgi:hypothetical protein